MYFNRPIETGLIKIDVTKLRAKFRKTFDFRNDRRLRAMIKRSGEIEWKRRTYVHKATETAHHRLRALICCSRFVVRNDL